MLSFVVLSWAPIALAQTTGSNVFLNSASQWTIPQGVTTLTIEGWGGGGGGSPFSGGQGGGYFKAVLPVPATAGVINSIDVTIGNGGSGCSMSSPNGVTGGDTRVTYKGITMTAGGGSGSNFAGATGGSAGTFSTSAPTKFYFRGATGQYGSVSRTVATTLLSAGNPAANPATFPAFYISAVGGDGGESGSSTNTHGAGGSEYLLVSQTASGFTSYSFSQVFKSVSNVNGVNGVVPGGGGGGTPNIPGPGIPATWMVNCGSGANGLVMFSW